MAEGTKITEQLPVVLTVEQAAEVMQLKTHTFRRRILNQPDFPKLKIGRQYRIPTKAMLKWMEEKGFENQ